MGCVTIVCDGQFGSTGKGLLSQWIAHSKQQADVYVSTASAQAGHTFYKNGKKLVAYHLSVAGASVGGFQMLAPGCVIDLDVLKEEVDTFYNGQWDMISIHPNAAIITNEDKEIDARNTHGISGTGKGVGEALARKVRRKAPNIAKDNEFLNDMGAVANWEQYLDTVNKYDVMLEIPQGASLGINGPFYPFATSRECTVMQGLSDALICPTNKKITTYMSVRTYPIRVGSLEGSSSGDCYQDQREISWEDINVPPEYTTVTGRQRRVFTFSFQQLRHSMVLNNPDYLFVNFMNYLSQDEQDEFVDKLHQFLHSEAWINHPEIIYGYGPRISDVVWAYGRPFVSRINV